MWAVYVEAESEAAPARAGIWWRPPPSQPGVQDFTGVNFCLLLFLCSALALVSKVGTSVIARLRRVAWMGRPVQCQNHTFPAGLDPSVVLASSSQL